MMDIAQKGGPEGAGGGKIAMVADIVRRFRHTPDWHQEVDDALALIGHHLDCQRTILFRMREVEGQGLAQSVFAFWADLRLLRENARPSVLSQAIVEADPLLERLSVEVRRGDIFEGHTSELTGFLRGDFERQAIKSFLSVPVFAHGYLWGTLAINECRQQRIWTADERSALDIVALSVGDAIEREQTEAHISETFRATMLQNALDGIVIIDESGGIIEFNPAAEQMFGWKRSELLGKSIAQTLIPTEHRSAHVAGLKNYLAGSPARMIGRRIETRGAGKDGQTFPIEVTISEVKAAGRKLFVGDIRDLRERRRAEEEINRQRERLHQTEKMAAMGALLAGVSHELNNPLAVVVAQSTLLHEFAADTQTKTRAEKVRAAAERCGRIVKSFLGMVRLHPTEQARTDLNQVVRSALEVTAYGARSSGIIVDTEMTEDALEVIGDPDHLTQVVANFLVNSQHAIASLTGERRIRVRTYVSQGNACFSVEDNGPGVPEEIRERIFESYFTTKPVGVGTGIGLSISKSIVERHNGHVRYETGDLGGARFVAEFPRVAVAPGDTVSTTTATANIRRALIIDDEPDVAGSLADILELMGVKSVVHSSWPAAREAAEDPGFDVVFSDLRMPGASGIEIFRELTGRRPELVSRFVLVTGDSMGARSEIEAINGLRPLVMEKPFSTLDVRGALAAIEDLVRMRA